MAEAKTKPERIVVEESPIGCSVSMAPIFERLEQAGYTCKDFPESKEGGSICVPGKNSLPLEEIFTDEEIFWLLERGGYIHTESEWRALA